MGVRKGPPGKGDDQLPQSLFNLLIDPRWDNIELSHIGEKGEKKDVSQESSAGERNRLEDWCVGEETKPEFGQGLLVNVGSADFAKRNTQIDSPVGDLHLSVHRDS